jgi:hypothetical protein
MLDEFCGTARSIRGTAAYTARSAAVCCEKLYCVVETQSVAIRRLSLRHANSASPSCRNMSNIPQNGPQTTLQAGRHNFNSLLTTATLKRRWLTEDLTKRSWKITGQIAKRTQTTGKVTKTMWAVAMSTDKQELASKDGDGSKASDIQELNVSRCRYC